jgi:ppGpp synthetase/RelA/SpoT-type nucleotidyltranferase
LQKSIIYLKKSEQMPRIPAVYDKVAYLEWHNSNVEIGGDLEREVVRIRTELAHGLGESLEQLGQLLVLIKDRTEPECRIQTNSLVTASIDVCIDNFRSDTYEKKLFKSVDSIIEKIWRKNCFSEGNPIKSTDISLRITDLVRTSVICPTLFHAREFALRLGNWTKYIQAAEEDSYSLIQDIRIDEEAKPSSGYFAYHCKVALVSGNTVEIQIYSSIGEAWRSISHRLYEKSRIGVSPHLVPGSSEARLISLGHLLHLAENELDRLMREIR